MGKGEGLMACDIIDIRCILVNELIGSSILAVLFIAIIYFIIANKLKLGFETSIVLAIPILIFSGLVVYGFQIIYAFATLFIGLLLAMAFLRLIGNK